MLCNKCNIMLAVCSDVAAHSDAAMNTAAAVHGDAAAHNNAEMQMNAAVHDKASVHMGAAVLSDAGSTMHGCSTNSPAQPMGSTAGKSQQHQAQRSYSQRMLLSHLKETGQGVKAQQCIPYVTT